MQSVRFGSEADMCGAKWLSALPPKADVCGAKGDVRFVPIADIATRAESLFKFFHQPVDVAEYPKILNFRAFKSENRRPIPPDVSARWRIAKQFATMISVVAKFSVDLVFLLYQIENIRSVLVKCADHHVNITGKLVIPSQNRTKRTTKGKVGMEDVRDQLLVGFIPHLLEKNTNDLLLRRQNDSIKRHRVFVHSLLTLIKPHGRSPAAARYERGRMIRISVNSPGCVSTSIRPPCCLTIIS